MNQYYLSQILGHRAVTMEEILDARERRASKQKALQIKHQKPLISFTLNMPGDIKTFPLANRVFEEGIMFIKNQLKEAHVTIEVLKICKEKTGHECFFVVDGDPESIKRNMIDIENRDSIGRLFDIDVLKENGQKISRKELSMEGRKCLLCREPAFVCARSEKHTKEEVLLKAVEIMTDYGASLEEE